MKRIFLLLIACCFLSTISAQSTRKIRELEAKRKELHQQIAESETLLQSTKKDVKSQLDNLALLTGQIEERRKYISTIESDVHTLTSEIASLHGVPFVAFVERLDADVQGRVVLLYFLCHRILQAVSQFAALLQLE